MLVDIAVPKEVVVARHDVGEGGVGVGQLVTLVTVVVTGVQEIVLGTQEIVVGMQ